MVVAVLGGGEGCSRGGSVLALEGDLNRLKGFEDCLGVAGVGSAEDDAEERRRFGKKNPSGPGSRLDWLEASLSDLSGVVPELKVGLWKPQITRREPLQRERSTIQLLASKVQACYTATRTSHVLSLFEK